MAKEIESDSEENQGGEFPESSWEEFFREPTEYEARKLFSAFAKSGEDTSSIHFIRFSRSDDLGNTYHKTVYNPDYRPRESSEEL